MVDITLNGEYIYIYIYIYTYIMWIWFTIHFANISWRIICWWNNVGKYDAESFTLHKIRISMKDYLFSLQYYENHGESFLLNERDREREREIDR